MITVGNLMSKGIVAVDGHTTIYEAAKIMGEKKIGCILVKLGGEDAIVTDADVVRKAIATDIDIKNTLVTKISSSPVISIDVNSSLEEANQMIYKHKTRYLVVTDNSVPAGILSVRDMCAPIDISTEGY